MSVPNHLQPRRRILVLNQPHRTEQIRTAFFFYEPPHKQHKLWVALHLPGRNFVVSTPV